MRPVTWLAAGLMVGLVPLFSPAQDAPAVPPSPAEAAPAPPTPAPDVAPGALPPTAAPAPEGVPAAPVPAPPTPAAESPAQPPQPPADVLVEPVQPGVELEAQPGGNYVVKSRRVTAHRAAPVPPPPHPQFRGNQDPNAAVREYTRNRLYTLRHAPGRPEKGSYLGVATSSPPEALQRQLQLKPGLGLVVDHIEPQSPAEQAGVKEYDVLQKLDDQLLINPEQLLVLVRMHKAGDEVKLTVIREGKPQVLTAKLTERDVAPIRLSFTAPDLKVNVNQFEQPWFTPDQIRLIPPTERAVVEDDVVIIDAGDGNRLQAASIVIEDAEHRMSINSTGGMKRLRVEDKSGGVVFDGPIQTEEELGKVPTDVRVKIEKMGLQRLTLPEGDAQWPGKATEPRKEHPQPRPTLEEVPAGPRQ